LVAILRGFIKKAKMDVILVLVILTLIFIAAMDALYGED